MILRRKIHMACRLIPAYSGLLTVAAVIFRFFRRQRNISCERSLFHTKVFFRTSLFTGEGRDEAETTSVSF